MKWQKLRGFLVGLTQVTGRELLGNPDLRNIVIYFYVANESLSIIKNADEAGVPVPKILIKGFSSLKEKQREGTISDLYLSAALTLQ